MRRLTTVLTAEEFGRSSLNLGRADENVAVRIEIDLSRILAQEPTATAHINVENPSGTEYAAVTRMDGTKLIWDVKKADNTIEGTGYAQLTVNGPNGEVLKSAVAATRVGHSIRGEGPAPDPVQNWIDDATNKLGAVVQAGEDAEKAAAKANDAAEAANESAKKAEDAADEATTAAGKSDTATSAANTAAKKAEDAATSATTAAGTANTAARNAATAAATAANAAKAARDVADIVQTKLDNGDLTGPKGDPGNDGLSAPQIDDTAVTATNPWSSKQIVDTLCQPISVTGNPVQCYPVEGYPLGVTASWEPTQAGSGDPSPENIRPITGRTAVQVERCGANLLNIAPFTKLIRNGITYEYIADGGVRISGTATANVDSPTFAVGFLPPGKCYGLDMDTSINTSIVIQRKGSKLWLDAKGIFEIMAGDVIKYWYMIVMNGETLDKTVYPYIVPGTSAPATYAPYSGSITTLTLPNTIYGGEVGADGAGRETWGCIESYAGEAVPAGWICDRAVYAEGGTPPTGAQVAYKLATPIPFTATGGGTIQAISGVNTILTDADTLTVTGREDPNHTISALASRVAALETAATNE